MSITTYSADVLMHDHKLSINLLLKKRRYNIKITLFVSSSDANELRARSSAACIVLYIIFLLQSGLSVIGPLPMQI